MGVRTRVSIIDFIIKKMRRAIAIVEDTDTASRNIAAGKYVLWKGVLTKASSAISSGTTLSSSNLTSLDDGAINDLDTRINTLNGNLMTLDSGSIASNNIAWYKIGRIAYIRISNGSFTTSAGGTIGTLPAVCKPVSSVDFLDSYSKKRIQIDTDGNVISMEALNNTVIRGTVSYITAT